MIYISTEKAVKKLSDRKYYEKMSDKKISYCVSRVCDLIKNDKFKDFSLLIKIMENERLNQDCYDEIVNCLWTKEDSFVSRYILFDCKNILSEENIELLIETVSLNSRYVPELLCDFKIINKETLNDVIGRLFRNCSYSFIKSMFDDKYEINDLKNKMFYYMIENNEFYYLSKIVDMEKITDEQLILLIDTLSNSINDLLDFIKTNIEVIKKRIAYIERFTRVVLSKHKIEPIYNLLKIYYDNSIFENMCANDKSYFGSMIEDEVKNIENPDIPTLYKYLILTGNRDKVLIDKIILSNDVKYIILTAIYIDNSLISKLFRNPLEMYYFVQNSNMFTMEEKKEVKAYMFGDIEDDIKADVTYKAYYLKNYYN